MPAAVRLSVNESDMNKVVGTLERLTKESRFKWTNDVMDRCCEIIKSHVKITAPRGETGELADSVDWYAEPDKRTVFVGADHGVFQEYGTQASPGRYIPAIGKRYRNDPVLLAARAAAERGIDPIYPSTLEYMETTEPYVLTSKGPAAGVFTPVRYVWVKGTSSIKTKPPTIIISTGGTRAEAGGQELLRVQVHEFVHAIQWMHREDPTVDPMSEEVAYTAEGIIDRIGVHPGVPATHFFARAVENAEPDIADMVQKYISDRVVQAASSGG